MNMVKKLVCGVISAAVALGAASAWAAGLPEGYAEVEYIQGNGTNARILTDYTPNPATDKIEAVVEFPSLDTTMNVWCARGSTASTATWSLFVLNSSGYKFRFDYNNTAGNYASPALSANTKYTVTADSSQFTWSGGTGVSYTKVDAFTAAGGPIALFASYYDGTDNHNDFYGKQKLYSFKIWKSGVLIHNFVPCKDGSGNPTLADVCDNPATLTRTGTFTAGRVVHYSDDNFEGTIAPSQVIPLFGGARKAYVFTDTLGLASLEVKRTLTLEKLLVVGGGGGGGGNMGGGGGGGGVIYSENLRILAAGEQIELAVGGGGVSAKNSRGSQGGTSSIKIGDDAIIEAFGGGGGSAENNFTPTSVEDGRIGSGGGGNGPFTDGQHYNSAQGHPGGVGGSRSTAGGGGALTNGYGPSGANRQNGGEGVTNSITGVAEVYGSGGGGGAGWANYGLSTCGKGGTRAGDGAEHGAGTGGTPGDDGFGGGGGGSSYPAGNGNGGSGTVILYIAERDTTQFRFVTLPVADAVCYGTPVHQEPVVSNIVTGAILEKNVDYVLSWTNDVADAAEPFCVCTVTATGIGDYLGIVSTVDYALRYAYQFEVDAIPNQAFLDEPSTPEVVVSNPVVGVSLANGVDYTVAYQDNAAVGTAKAIVSGKAGSDYEGFVVTNSFEIVEVYADDYVYTADRSVRRIDVDDRKVYVFTNTAGRVDLNLRTNMTLVEALVVGGGGQGGGVLAGGGGGGGVVTNNVKRVVFSGDSFEVVVGAGGRSSTTGDAQGNKGEASSLQCGVFSLVAYGGGGGGTCNDTTKDGVNIPKGTPTNSGLDGSGGGSSRDVDCHVDGVYYNSSQGNWGGNASGYYGGGGGGAGGPGKPAANSASGNGGEGITNSITGVAEVYGSGGGGGGGQSGTGGQEGQGGTHAGAGAVYNVTGIGSDADDGFGGGGGGGGFKTTPRRGGAGGSGTVILAFTVGGTAGQPELSAGDVDFGFLGGYTIPDVSFALGGDPGAVYSATVTVSLGVGEETTPRYSRVFVDKHLGDEVSLVADFSAVPGAEVWCSIVIEATGAATRTVRLVRTATGSLAPFAGHGGGEGVIHVWAAAPGDGSGSSWVNAVRNLADALAMLSASKAEVWIIGDLTLDSRISVVLMGDSAVRGGFTGVEDAVSDRQRGARSVISGADASDLLLFSGSQLLTLDSIEFTHALNRAVERTGGSLFVTNCSFEANGTTVTTKAGRALYATGASGKTAQFIDTRFARNTEKGTYAAEGCCVLMETFARATFDNCTFVTNGIIPNVNSGSSGYGEGSYFKGAALKVTGVPLTMRNCRFFVNRAACRGGQNNGGTVRLFGSSYPSAFTNCLFVGNSERQPHGSASESFETGGGALVLDLGSASGLVDVYGCTFAWNLADCRRSPAGLNVRKGTVRVRNSVFWGNARRDVGTAGRDIDLKTDGTADVDYSLFEDGTEACITAADATKLTLGAHNTWGNPRFATRDEDLAGIIKTNAANFNFIYFDWNRLGELINFNAHLRGGRGYFDEKTGELSKAYLAGPNSPAIDAGDPESDYSREPDCLQGWHGKRRNLGYYGNTPWATMTPYSGGLLILR